MSRVSPIYLSSSTCSSSPSPLYVSTVVQCPCFLRYILSSDLPTEWDVFLLPKPAYDLWKADRYQGTPTDYIPEFSSLKFSTTGPHSFLRVDDTNVFLSGQHQLAIRAKDPETRCFNTPSVSGISSQVVFESMPTPCPIHVTPRIVGGSTLNDSDPFPWMAVIWLAGERPICGAAQIAPGYVVTAAHCHVHLSVSAYTVRVGTQQADVGKEYRILRAFTHPKYHQLDTNEALFDIAILELDSREYSQVISYNNNPDLPPSGSIVTTAGFGYISEGWTALPQPNHLLRVDVPVVSEDSCNERFENVESDLHLCAGYDEGGCDSCQSDSGGPLRYIDDEGTELLVGIVSFGSGCARSKSPGVYTRVSTFSTWINSTIAEAVETRSDGGVFQNPIAIVGIVGGVVIIGAFAAIGGFMLWKKKGGVGGGGGLNGDGSSVPSMSGISG